MAETFSRMDALDCAAVHAEAMTTAVNDQTRSVTNRIMRPPNIVELVERTNERCRV
jgi:hypothetical protein